MKWDNARLQLPADRAAQNDLIARMVLWALIAVVVGGFLVFNANELAVWIEWLTAQW